MTELFTEIDGSYVYVIAELYRSAFGHEPWNDDWSDEEQLRAYIKDLACAFNSLNFGLFSGDRLVAVSIGSIRHWWEGTNYILEEFCVSPEFQGQGIGSRFMSLIENELRSRGIAGIFLQTENDKPSYSFYRKNGFGEMTSHVSFFKSLK